MEISKGLNNVRRGVASFSFIAIVASLFAANVAQAGAFKDVQPSDWFYTYVEQLAADGVLNTSTGTYRPGDLVNRAEMAKLAVEAFKLKLETPDTPTFKDVPKSEWFYSYIETAAKNGIVGGYNNNEGKATGYFGPADSLTREQAMKIVVLAAPLTENTKNGPHFSDVPNTRWSYKYVETGYNMSVVDGYKDGSFGPENKIKRAEIAKMVSNAMNPVVRPGSGFDLSSATAKSATKVEVCFSNAVDPTSAGVAANYVVKDATGTALAVSAVAVSTDLKCVTLTTATQVSGTSYGVEVSKVTSSANENLLSTKITFNGFNPNAPTTQGGDVNVELNSNSPAATNVPCDVQSLTYAKFNFSASSKDVAINGVTLKRTGLGTKDDFSKVWFEDKDGNRVTSRQTIGSDDYVTLNFSPALTIKANSTSTLSLMAKLKAYNDNSPANGIKDSGESCYTGRIDAFQIEKAEAVTIDGGKVSGSFPVVGASMTTADYSTASVTATIGGSATTYQVGEVNQEFGQWKLSNGSSTRDILVKTLTIKNEGTGRIAKDLTNLQVVVDGKKISTSATVSGEYVTFNLNNYVLAAGRTDTFYVRADVIGMDSATSDTIQFTVRYPEDFSAVEATTGFGVNHNLDTVISSGSAVIYTIQGGDTTFVKSSTAPSSQTKPRGATTVTFLESNLIVKQDFNTDAIKVKLYSNVDATMAGLVPAAAGTAATATKTAADLKNLKLYVDNSLVQTKSGDVGDFTSCVNDATLAANGISCVLNFDSTVLLKQGTRTIKLVGDIENNAVSGDAFRAEISGASAFQSAKYADNDRSIATVAGTVTAGDVTIGDSKLTVTENSGYTAGQKFVAGVQNSTIAKYLVKANDSDTITVTRLKFGLVGAGVSGADLTSASVYVDGKQTGSTKSFTTGVAGTVQFTDVNFKVSANQQSTIELKVSMTNSASGTLQVALQEMDAKDSSSTNAKINGADPMASVNSVAVSVVPTGALTIASNSNSVSSSYVVADSAEHELGKFTLSSQDDDIKVTNLYLHTTNSVASNISTVALYGNDGTKLADGNVNGQYVYFDMGDSSKMIVPKNVNNYTITVKAKFNQITQSSQSGAVLQLEINGSPADAVTGTIAAVGMRAVSASNNSTLAAAKLTESGTAATNALALVKSTMTLASVDDSSLVSTNQKLAVNNAMKAYAFSVAADANGDIELSSFVLNLASSGGATVGGVKVYASDDTGNTLNTSAALANGNNTVTLNNAQRIAAGTKKTFIVELDVTAAPANSSLAIKLAKGAADTAFSTFVAGDTKWSDFSDSAHVSTPWSSFGAGIPVVIQYSDWFQGYKVSGIDSMGSRSYSNY